MSNITTVTTTQEVWDLVKMDVYDDENFIKMTYNSVTKKYALHNVDGTVDIYDNEGNCVTIEASKYHDYFLQ